MNLKNSSMKNSKIKFLLIVMLVTIICVSASAQTNVERRNLYKYNMTVANSPYIVTDTIVVFPELRLLLSRELRWNLQTENTWRYVREV